MYGAMKDSDKIAHMRRQQIDSIKIFNDRVTEITEGSEYKVDFSSNGKLFCVLIQLGKDFPLEKPVLKVEPSVNHPWVNGSSGEIVAAPGLLKFTIHSELGRVIQAIVREFELRPPTLNDDYQKEFRPNENSNETSSVSCLGASNGDTTIASNLNLLTITELEKLNNEPEKLDKFVNELPYLSDLAKILENEITNVENLAQENLNRENEVLSLKTEVNNLTCCLSEIFAEYQSLTAQYSKLCEKFDPHSIRGNLVDSIAKVDEESEKIAENFLNGEVDLEKFLADYSSHRYLSHSRKFKAENLSQQLNKLQQSRF